MPVVGTAGHVDHGKSSLVEALTGVHPDRWAQERERGMTIDLGFAPLRLEGGIEAGVVDVPGHERFLRNMLAGASGMDVLLLAVDAREGPKPQTFEHLDILRFLNVRSIVVAATKVDAVESGKRADAYRAIERALVHTPAAGLTPIGVSSRTGEGLDDLRRALAAALRDLPVPDPAAPAYLPIDRVFSLPGLGTIVTGTLAQGRIAPGETIALQPAGVRVKVRGIESFGVPQAVAMGGTRVALHLGGVSHREIARGDAIAGEGLKPCSRFAVAFTPLAAALPALRRRTPVRLHLGAAEYAATLVFERVPDRAGEVAAELLLRAPAIAFAGARFVVRRASPNLVLGGGWIAGFETARIVDRGVAAILADRGLEAVTAAEVAGDANLREAAAAAALEGLVLSGSALALHKPDGYVSAAAASELCDRVVEHLARAQSLEPWAAGVTSLALARATGIDERALLRLLNAFAIQGRIVRRAGYYATPGHRPEFSPEQRALFAGVLPADPTQPYVPVPFSQALAAIRRSAVPGALKAFDTLLSSGGAIRVGEDLYRAEQIAAIRVRLDEHFRRHRELTPAQLRDALQSSRKYVMPLLEWLDATGLTIRTREARVARDRQPATQGVSLEG